MLNLLTFKSEFICGGTRALTPCIDGMPLSDLVTDFELSKGYNDPAGGYGGIVPAHHRLGPLASYFMGKEYSFGIEASHRIYALFCECGEAGCWSLTVQVRINIDTVVWDNFAQPHRPTRKYIKFGPFIFARAAYEKPS